MDYLATSILSVLLSAANPAPEPEPAHVPVFVGEIVPTERPDRRFIEQRYLVQPNVVELARNPRVLDLELPWSAIERFQVREFKPESGFTFNDDGSVIPSDEPTDLTYYLRGKGEAGELFITVRNGRVLLDLVGRDAASVQPVAGGHALDNLDRAYIGSAACGVDPTVGPLASVSIPKKAPATSIVSKVDFEITIMVAYTPQALALAGSVQAIQDRAAAAINQLNSALYESGQTIHIRVAQAGDVFPVLVNEIEYAQQPNPAFRHKTVRNLTRQDASTNAQREAVDADLVVTLMADSGNPAGFPPVGPFFGVAFLQYPNCQDAAGFDACNPGPDFRAWAFATVAYEFATSNASFAHEVGHLFGAEHEPLRGTFQGQRAELYPYGHRVPGVIRDIMAQPECVPDTGATVCTGPIAFQFSNPDTFFVGTAFPSGTFAPVYTADGNRTRNGSRVMREYASAMVDFEGGTTQPQRLFWDGFE